MKVLPTRLPEVLLIEPLVHADGRGELFESWNRRDFEAATGLALDFPQDNLTRSVRGALRGLHYQLSPAQGKLVRVLRGRIFDVAVDLRRSSPRFGQWEGILLDGGSARALWIPPGFGHGFLALSDEAEVLYKLGALREPAVERAIAWDDPQLAIGWPLAPGQQPVLSATDRAAPRLAVAEVYP
jgi:dTDP-4-dehydrorhamnose 3,5-epimerase